MVSKAGKIFSSLLSVPVYFYKYAISPFLRPSCRHVPSCSQYALDALNLYGPVRGSFMTIGRILRCRPGGTHGYDPVPKFRFIKYRPYRSYPKCNRLKR
jgi:putative membrane protein insertion efficiency factor